MIEQGTDAWRLQRCGFATASRFADVMATVKTGESADRRNYRAQFVCERLTGKPVETYSNRAMLVGTEREPDARALYQVRTRRLVDEAGFVRIEGMAAGASPDGLIGDDGLLEIKCPNPATHIDYLRLPVGECPKAYFWQVQGRCLPLAGHGAISCRITRSSPASCKSSFAACSATSKRWQTGNGAGKFEEVDAEEAESSRDDDKGSRMNLAQLAFTGTP